MIALPRKTVRDALDYRIWHRCTRKRDIFQAITKTKRLCMAARPLLFAVDSGMTLTAPPGTNERRWLGQSHLGRSEVARECEQCVSPFVLVGL